MPWPRRVRITARGHPAVRAAHDKTLELTADADLTERGTCILGVAADLNALANHLPLAGPLRITIAAGDVADTLHAVANPFAAPTRRLVVRRSDHRDADTLAGLADRGAADLDRHLLEALRDPAAEIRVDIVEAGDEPVANAILRVQPGPEPSRPPANALDRLRAGDRITITADRRGLTERQADLVRGASAAGATVAVTPDGWQVPPVLVVAGIATPPHLDAGRLTRAAPLPAAAVPLAATCRRDDLDAVRPQLPDSALVTSDPPSPYDTHRPPTGETVAIAVAPTEATPADVDRIVARLAAARVPVRTLADALASTTGLSRRAAYDRVIRLRDRGPHGQEPGVGPPV